MAEKRRSTTFRTSKGTIVNVHYPDIYVSPAFLSTEDVTSPAEMRAALREEVRDAIYEELAKYSSLPQNYHIGSHRGLKVSPLDEPSRTLSIVGGATGTLRLTPKRQVLDIGLLGSWESLYVTGPCVIPFNGLLYMYYSGYNGTHGQIGLAMSDDGINWIKHAGNPVLTVTPGSWDSVNVEAPDVLRIGNTWIMVYRGYDGVGGHGRIGFATSPDGITWTKSPANPVLSPVAGTWESWELGHPFIRYDDVTNLYRLWYGGTDGAVEQIGYATSPDLVTWTRNIGNPVLRIGAATAWDSRVVSSPWIILVKLPSGREIYYMWYEGAASGPESFQIGFATSDDGLTWVKSPYNPVLSTQSGRFDSVLTAAMAVLRVNGRFYMWYEGKDTANYRIGYAVSDDGVNWHRGLLWRIQSWTITKGADITVTSITIDGADTKKTDDEFDALNSFGSVLDCEDEFTVVASNAGGVAENLTVELFGLKTMKV